MFYKLWVIRLPIPDTPLQCSLVFGGSFVPKRGSFPIFSLSTWNLYSRSPHFTILSVLYIVSPYSLCYHHSKTSAPLTTTFQSGFVTENKITLFQYFVQPIASPKPEDKSCFGQKFFFVLLVEGGGIVLQCCVVWENNFSSSMFELAFRRCPGAAGFSWEQNGT